MGKISVLPPRARSGKKKPVDDNAAYIVPLSAFTRPRIYIINGDEFEWPMTDGIEFSGQATLAEHRYVSDNVLVVQVMHRDSTRIEMSGVFPGKTGPLNARALYRFCVLPDPPDFKRLEVPGVFTQAQQVVASDWTFSRVEGQPWDFNYRVSFVKVGTSKLQNAPKQGKGSTSDFSPTSGIPGDERGQSSNTYTVNTGNQTLRAVAMVVYGNSDQWVTLYRLNKDLLMDIFQDIPSPRLPVTTIPLGTNLRFA